MSQAPLFELDPPPAVDERAADLAGKPCRTASPVVEGGRIIVDGWRKTAPTGGAPLPVLNVIRGDGCGYEPARYELLAGATVGAWRSGDRAVLTAGDETISLLDAVARGLAREVPSL